MNVKKKKNRCPSVPPLYPGHHNLNRKKFDIPPVWHHPTRRYRGLDELQPTLLKDASIQDSTFLV